MQTIVMRTPCRADSLAKPAADVVRADLSGPAGEAIATMDPSRQTVRSQRSAPARGLFAAVALRSRRRHLHRSLLHGRGPRPEIGSAPRRRRPRRGAIVIVEADPALIGPVRVLPSRLGNLLRSGSLERVGSPALAPCPLDLPVVLRRDPGACLPSSRRRSADRAARN